VGEAAAVSSDENINVRAAFIHALGDLVQSAGVVIAAVIIWAKPEYHIADPICTFLFSVLVLFTTWGILKTAFYALLNSVPAGVDFPKLAVKLAALPGVANVHDLHVWSYGTGLVAMTVHLVADHPGRALHGAQLLAKRFGISHSTVQVERCGSAQVADCYSYNEHMSACALTLSPTAAERFASAVKRKRAAAPSPVSFDGAAAPPRRDDDGDDDNVVLDRPHPLSRHLTGCNDRIITDERNAEAGGRAAGNADAAAQTLPPRPPPGVGAAHGHAHGGAHGHQAHAHGAAPASGAAHGHSHAAHGHSHAAH
jgi:hypothetical protein